MDENFLEKGKLQWSKPESYPIHHNPVYKDIIEYMITVYGKDSIHTKIP